MTNIEIDIENKIIYIGEIKFCELYKLKDAIVNIDEYTIKTKEEVKPFTIPQNPYPWQPWQPSAPWNEPCPWINPSPIYGPGSNPEYFGNEKMTTVTFDQSHWDDLFNTYKDNKDPESSEDNGTNINENHD